MLKIKPVSKSFKATLERGGRRLNLVIVNIPFDVAKIWGKRGQLRVKGEISGFPFRATLFPKGNGEHGLLVTKRVQAEAKVRAGSTVQFRLEPDTEKRSFTVPAELLEILSEDGSFLRWFEQLSEGTRRSVAYFVNSVKSAEARVRRAERMAELLLATMDAEQELPPILRLAFARNPRAYEGWKRMSPSRRRGHLFGIFYCRSPEARARRVARAVQDAFELAERTGKRSE